MKKMQNIGVKVYNALMKKAVKEAFTDSLSVLPGYVVLGIGFGVTLVEKGYGIMEALAMSVLIYAGSMQYVTISLLSSCASLISAAAMTLVVNARHLFYGIAMLKPYSRLKKHKVYDIFALTDETFSIVVDKDIADDERDDYTFVLSAVNQVYWVVGSVLGALLGHVLPFSFEGIDFSMTILFFCVFLNQWKAQKDHVPALSALIISILCRIIVGSENFMIVSIILIVVFLLLLNRIREVRK